MWNKHKNVLNKGNSTPLFIRKIIVVVYVETCSTALGCFIERSVKVASNRIRKNMCLASNFLITLLNVSVIENSLRIRKGNPQ